MHLTGEVQASTLAHPEEWFFDALTWGSSDSGETVNAVSALSHGPVWQAINILAGDVGQLPWHKMIKTDGGAERDPEHPTEWLIAEQPNAWQTPSVWRELMMSWALGWGNGISGVIRNGKGEREFLPFLPDRTSFVQDEQYGYLITTRLADHRMIAAAPDEVFHIRGLTSNGFWGLSAVQTCKNVIGHGLALQRHGNTTFKNGARIGGILESPGAPPPPEVRAQYRSEWESLHSGGANAGRVAMLYGGMQFKAAAMSNDDAQWLDARRLDREYVASLFNLPAFKLNALEHSAVRANLEEQNRDYFNTSLSRWLNRFNEEAKRKLLSMNERRSRKHFYRWFPEAFLRGDIQKRYAAYSQAIASRFMNPNEVREKEDLNRYEGGDDYKNPAIDKAAEQEKPAPEEGDDEVKELAKSLMRNQVAALLETEANTVQKVAASKGNFIKWVDNYYENYSKLAKNFLDLPCQLAVKSGFAAADWRAATYDHAHQSQTALLAMAGLADKQSLPEIGEQAADSIRVQADQLTAAILGG